MPGDFESEDWLIWSYFLDFSLPTIKYGPCGVRLSILIALIVVISNLFHAVSYKGKADEPSCEQPGSNAFACTFISIINLRTDPHNCVVQTELSMVLKRLRHCQPSICSICLAHILYVIHSLTVPFPTSGANKNKIYICILMKAVVNSGIHEHKLACAPDVLGSGSLPFSYIYI